MALEVIKAKKSCISFNMKEHGVLICDEKFINFETQREIQSKFR